jgi:methionyl aminopeptidase
MAREVLDIAASHVKPGITTDEIDSIVHEAIIERGGYPSPLNYREFPKSVCTLVAGRLGVVSVLLTLSRSVNEVICHGIPDQRKLEDGDIVNLGGSPHIILVTHE